MEPSLVVNQKRLLRYLNTNETASIGKQYIALTIGKRFLVMFVLMSTKSQWHVTERIQTALFGGETSSQCSQGIRGDFGPPFPSGDIQPIDRVYQAAGTRSGDLAVGFPVLTR